MPLHSSMARSIWYSGRQRARSPSTAPRRSLPAAAAAANSQSVSPSAGDRPRRRSHPDLPPGRRYRGGRETHSTARWSRPVPDPGRAPPRGPQCAFARSARRTTAPAAPAARRPPPAPAVGRAPLRRAPLRESPRTCCCSRLSVGQFGLGDRGDRQIATLGGSGRRNRGLGRTR